MQGHEGLGEVLECGKDVKDVQEGDLVATRGELHTQMNTMSVQELMLKFQDLIPNTSLSPLLVV